MDVGLASYGFAALAGVLSVLSPCVLPILPILLASAISQHRWGPWALAGGLALSFAVIGTAIAWLGASMNLEPTAFRMAAAVMLALFGIILLSSGLQQRFAGATGGISNAGHVLLSHLNLAGIRGQLVIGLVLGIVWSPCVGPTLGAAVTLASQSTQLTKVALTMAIFGLGAAAPIVLFGLVSRNLLSNQRGRLATISKYGKFVMGITLVVVSVGMLSGSDKAVEIYLIEHSPGWLTSLTTRF